MVVVQRQGSLVKSQMAAATIGATAATTHKLNEKYLYVQRSPRLNIGAQ